MTTLFSISKSRKSAYTLVFRQVYAGKTKSGASDAILCGMRINKAGEIRHLAQLTVKDGENEKGSFLSGISSYHILPTGEILNCADRTEFSVMIRYRINVLDQVARTMYDEIARITTTSERRGVKVSDCQLHIRCKDEKLFNILKEDGTEYGVDWTNVLSVELVSKEDKAYVSDGAITVDGSVHGRTLYNRVSESRHLDETGYRKFLQQSSPIRRVVEVKSVESEPGESTEPSTSEVFLGVPVLDDSDNIPF
jgi:hypothetical protein